MDEENVMILGQIQEALGGMINAAVGETSDIADDEVPSNVLHVTPEGVTFQGYSVEEIASLENIVTNILGKFPAETKERKAGFTQ